MLGLFSRIRPLLTVDSANRIHKVMVLPVLDFCDIVFHECGREIKMSWNVYKEEQVELFIAIQVCYLLMISLISLDGKLYIREEKITS